jgi:endonuclease YncB( thermonuclease family)
MSRVPTPFLLVLAITAAALAACGRPPGLFTDRPTQAVAPVIPQIQVLRDDVLVIDGRRLRLADATLPQATPAAHCAAEAVAARQAELRLIQLARGVREVAITPTGGVDDNGRALVSLEFDGVDPARTLIDEGLAVAPQRASFDWCGAESTTQQAARRIAVLSFVGG